MSKVYVVQETNLDYSEAEAFGDLVFLSIDRRDDFNSVANSEHNERMLSHLAHGLRNFNEDEDWFVITGSPYISAAVFWLFGQRRARKLRLLRWDNREFRYLPIPLQLRQETIANER